jgi:hypothetical protein
MKTVIVVLTLEEYGMLLGVVGYAADNFPVESETNAKLKELKSTLENSMKVTL